MKRTFKRFALGLALAIGAGWVACGGPSVAAADCEALFPTAPLPGHPRLPTRDFTTLQDAPTQVTEARVVDAAGDVPAHCRVEGYVSPNVAFVLRMPGSSAQIDKCLLVGSGCTGRKPLQGLNNSELD